MYLTHKQDDGSSRFGNHLYDVASDTPLGKRNVCGGLMRTAAFRVFSVLVVLIPGRSGATKQSSVVPISQSCRRGVRALLA
jgi:hypothetical protein